LLLFLFFFVNNSSALGISPAVVNLDFKPGEKIEIDYKVSSDFSDQRIIVFTKGDLAEHVKLSTNELTGSGMFRATITLPDSIDKPGPHTISIGVEEAPNEGGAIGTLVRVIGVVKVFVPYPGKYAEAELKIGDGNIDENIPFEVYVVNRGREDINVDVNLLFIDGLGERVGTMQFPSHLMASGQEKTFKGTLNTEGYKPGNYMAEAYINYGDELMTNKSFRIGSLFVNITNFTTELKKEGIQRFSIDIESMWNENIKEVFADVNISNEFESITFRTPSEELNAWNRKTLVGFLDTSTLEGEYKTEITLNYLGEQTVTYGTFRIKEFNLIYLMIGIIIVLIGVIVFFVRNRKAFNPRKK